MIGKNRRRRDGVFEVVFKIFILHLNHAGGVCVNKILTQRKQDKQKLLCSLDPLSLR
jgi:hypothetical protein